MRDHSRNTDLHNPRFADKGQVRHLLRGLPAILILPVPPMSACTVPLIGIKAKKIPIVQPNLTFWRQKNDER